MSKPDLIKVGITGQNGFIGRHLYNYLSLQEGIQLILFKKSYFENFEQLGQFAASCDVIVHLAAMNRHSDPTFIYEINVKLVNKLIGACDAHMARPHIIFASSTQEDKDNLYGQSKKKGWQLLEDWAVKSGAKISGLIIPNVFGPFGKPFYNSVVATFCHQIANHQKPTVISDSKVKLIYVNELVEKIHQVIGQGTFGKIYIEHEYEISVSSLLEKVKHFYEKYMQNGEFPAINDPLDLNLFNTFRCYVPNDYYPRPFVKHSDDRGFFVEIVRADTPGQFSYSSTKPGITRGNHFHTRKAERFAVIKGTASIQLRKIDSKEVIEYTIDGAKPAYVDMPIWYTHNITNVGKEELITLFWINEPYKPEDADTYFINV